MRKYCVIRRTTVLNDELKLPRPKITNTVLLIAEKPLCEQKINEEVLKPENISSDDIRVDYIMQPYRNQKTNTSYRPHK